ncbi:hypothetical protein EJB05_29449, partial [Eragrostis curvula]
MAIPVARVHLTVAHAALPALLPTPPVWKMMMMPEPLFSTPPPCAFVIVPKQSPSLPKPGRADAEERWDARKKAVSPASSAAGHRRRRSPESDSTSAGRASSSSERWDSRKKKSVMSASSSRSSVSRADSMERASGGGDSPIGGASSTERWDSNKRTLSRVSSSAEHLNTYMKHRPLLPGDRLDVDDDGESSSTGSNDIE